MKHWKNGVSRLGGECMVREVYWHDLLLSLYITYEYIWHIQSRGFLGGRATHGSFKQMRKNRKYGHGQWHHCGTKMDEILAAFGVATAMPTSCRRCVHCKKKVGGNTVSERTNIHQKSRDFGRSITTRSDLDTWIWWSFGTPISGQTSVSEEILLFGGLPQRARRTQDIVEKGWQVLGQDRWAE